MIDKTLTPSAYLVKIQKKKYTYIIIPLVMVLVSFILSFQTEHPALRYISLAGLLIYLIISYLFRIKRLYEQPDCSSDCTVAPIYGTIVSIQNNRITIRKKSWQLPEIRNPQISTDESGLQFSKKIELFENIASAKLAKLVGIVLGNVICTIKIPQNQKIEVELGESVIAGVTLLASEPENE